MKLVVLDGYPSNPGDLSWEEFSAFGEVAVYDRTPPELVIPRLEGAGIVLLNKVPMTAEILDACPALRLICILATGYNIIDTAAAAARGVTVCNVPAYSTDSVAQHTMALLLEICLHVGDYDRSVHAGDWVRSPDYCYYVHPLIELAGKTMGIVGYGNIGQRVAQLARAFGMRILYYSRTRRPELEDEAVRYAPLDDLLAQSDVVTLHCPLTPETQGLIGRQAVACMKRGAILLNATRGPVIDDEAVAEALTGGHLYAAGLDVLSSEPPRADHPLLHAPNCVITPHVAWAPFAARRRLLEVTRRNVACFLAGSPQNRVN